MPVLKLVSEKLEKIYLPSTEKETDEENRAWVVMDCSPLLTGDADAVEQDAKNAGQATRYMMAERIKEWNFTEQDGTPIEISYESLKRLELTDFSFLQAKLGDGDEGALTDDEKKASSDTLSPPAMAGNIVITDGNSL